MNETRVLVLAPRGRDAPVAVALLARHGIEAEACGDLADLTEGLRAVAGTAVIAEEALSGPGLADLVELLENQPPWSDFPLIVLSNGHTGLRSPQALERLDLLRNVVLLDRPLHAEALVRAVKSALGARRRQFDARDHLARSREELEALVVERTREREEALALLHEAQKMETIGQLTGGVAHDFNNLLTPVMGSLDLLRRRIPAEDARAVRLVETAMQATGRAATLVQRLLAFARRQDLQPRSVDVASLLTGMEDLISRSIGPTITVNVRAAPDLPPARVDPSQLELAILNLAINGRDAMPNGGTLTIAASEFVAKGPRAVRLGREPFVRISVTDTGVGMDAATLKRAVEPFFSTKGLGKGTGLGLSMVHGLAAQSGGDLMLESTLSVGTTAELLLPLAGEAADAGPAGDLPALQATRPAVILLVDDEELVRTGTAEMLIDLGYTVIQAASGAEALRVLRSDDLDIHLLVSDYMMPGMNGADLIEASSRLRPGLPALLVTGYANISTGPAPSMPRLAKPFRQAELAARIAELLKPRPLDGAVLPFARPAGA